MASLASLLARDAIVSLDTIEQALQRQVLEGGELDTALLELTPVPENVLAAYRAASFQLPAVARAELEALDSGLLARVPIEVAREHSVVPIAHFGEALVLACAFPLQAAEAQRLSDRLRSGIAVRIGTELRVRAALARHYGIELGSRMRLLVERLAQHDAGELCEVQPLRPSGPAPARSTPAPRPEPRAIRPERAAHAESSNSSATVRVLPVVTLGSAPPPGARAERTTPDPQATRPSRPSRLPPPRGRQSSRSLRRITGAPRGPLTRQQTVELLGQAHDRDRVLEIFFSFARQYFECTVLFALRDERLLGLEASGLPQVADLHTVDVPIARSGSVQTAVRTRGPRVVRLDANKQDRALIEAIGRTDAQPCALIPVVIRERVVSLLYGDCSGEPIALTELADLLASLPAVSAAFERIIQERKVEAMKARREPEARSSQEPPAPDGVFGRAHLAPRLTPRGMAPQKAVTTAGLVAVGGPAEAVVAAPRPSASGALLPPPPLEDDIADRPTISLSIEGIASAVRRSSERPPAPGTNVDIPELRPRKRKEQDITRPERPSKLPPGPRAAAPSPARLAPDPPSPRTLSQPAAGTGSYNVKETASEVLARRGSGGSEPPPGKVDGHAAAAPAHASRNARPDPRRDGTAGMQSEVVSIPAKVRDSLRPARIGEQPEQEAIVVDLHSEAARVVEELCRTGPDEERPHVAALLRLGESALEVLEKRFPGPLWFDRHKPRQRMPAGRDVSAIARALFAFEEAAVPRVAALLASPQPDVRLCATMFSTDCVHPELLWPLYQRLFDPDGQVRLAAFEVLPLFRHVAGFDEVLKSLRQKAMAGAEAVPNRLAALEAISMLRDTGSIDLLADLSGHASRQLSVPAHRTLVAITAQDFGNVPKKWKAWIDKNRRKHRAEWLMEGLTHAEERVRALAGTELQKLTQVYYGYVASGTKRDRELTQKRYRDWWQAEGRAQFGG